MQSKHIHPDSSTTMCVDGVSRPMTEGEQHLYNVGGAAYLAMLSWRKSFWLMVVANLVLVVLLWMR